MGIGLFVVKEVVLAHGGSIQIESDIGQGTKFLIRLPTTLFATERADIELSSSL
jgi:signal transduction histidine kinase